MNQHQATTLYTALLEATVSSSISNAPDHSAAVRALVGSANAFGHLKLESPWCISSTYHQELTHRAGGTPPGGWQALAGLLVGARLFDAEPQRGFVPVVSANEFDDLSAEQLQQRLVEGFLRYFGPPTTMAGLLMLLGVHPYWGLRLAYEAQRATSMATHRPWYDDHNNFPPAVFEAAQQMLMTMISALFDVLLSLEHDRRYRADVLARFVLEASVLVRELEQYPQELPTPVFIFSIQTYRDCEASLRRASAFVINDLFKSCLVPAGVVQCFEDDTFCVNTDALRPDYRMHLYGTLADGGGLARVFAQNDNEKCA